MAMFNFKLTVNYFPWKSSLRYYTLFFPWRGPYSIISSSQLTQVEEESRRRSINIKVNKPTLKKEHADTTF